MKWQRATRYAVVLTVMLAMFLILACSNAPQPDYCNLDPKPLICD